MKKLFSLILVFALVFSLSVNAFAAIDLTNSFYDDAAYLVPNDDNNTLFGVLDTSSLTDTQKDYLIDFFSVMTGKTSSEDYYYVFGTSGYNGVSCLYFVCSPSFLNASYTSSSSSNLAICSHELGFYFNYLAFRSDSSSGLFSVFKSSINDNARIFYLGTHTTATVPTSSISSVGALLWSNHSDPLTYLSEPVSTAFSTKTTAANVSALNFIYDGQLGFVDNSGLIDSISNSGDTGDTGGDSSESSGGSDGGGGTSEDTDNKGSITLPNIENNSAIPYDLNAWNVVLDSTMPTLRKVFSIGFPLFLIFLGVQIMLGLIRKFTLSWLGGGRHGGGGNIKHD